MHLEIKTFSQKKFQRHFCECFIKIEMDSDTKIHICKVEGCGKKLKRNFYNHYVRQHYDYVVENWHHCNICNKLYAPSKYKLSQHHSYYHGLFKEALECETCNKTIVGYPHVQVRLPTATKMLSEHVAVCNPGEFSKILPKCQICQMYV